MEQRDVTIHQILDAVADLLRRKIEPLASLGFRHFGDVISRRQRQHQRYARDNERRPTIGVLVRPWSGKRFHPTAVCWRLWPNLRLPANTAFSGGRADRCLNALPDRVVK